MTTIYFDSERDAAELMAALTAEGYDTSLTREGFAGEDDSDDRAWVLTAVPFDERVVEMVDVHGGWLPGDVHLGSPPLDLPGEPRRLKDR
ncbi:hypothetical protein [Aeromicrobium sp.]|uniref:hypothetical protein n=1 Tax=Aeromicrobium sp. TaxID=1871063 RepID=UPI0019BE46B1|nr:hypothetical protein [Aeromicrobium sp.]MBC7632872.1 hypothetical protein [Aeromicrobium sp.]